jgi:hypothetical protein
MNMFQTYVPNQKVQGKKITLHYYYYLKMQWLGISKQEIFLIWLKFQNLSNLKNVFTNYFYNENPYLNVSYIFQKLNGSNKMKVWCS